MAFDAFLKIDGIDGESVTKGHEKWIELLSFNWGAATQDSENGGAGLGGGRTVGRVRPDGFSFTKATDSSSPKIFVKLCGGNHFQKVNLVCRKAGGESGDRGDDFIKIDFFDVFFTSYSEGGNKGTDPVPLESISFNFAKVEFGVLAMSTSGDGGNLVNGGWDFRANRSL